MAADRRYKTRKKAFEPYPEVFRLRILEKFMTKEEIDNITKRYKEQCVQLRNYRFRNAHFLR